MKHKGKLLVGKWLYQIEIYFQNFYVSVYRGERTERKRETKKKTESFKTKEFLYFFHFTLDFYTFDGYVFIPMSYMPNIVHHT